MPQLSLYIDKSTLEKIEQAANIEHTSISKWVSSKLKNILNNSWPKHYFEQFGSIIDSSFKKPEQLPFENETKRETL